MRGAWVAVLVVLALEGCDGATDQESSVDAGPCAPDACVMPLCGWVMTGSGEICIVKPDCTDLAETQCSATLGCRAVRGRRVSDPPATVSYVGCGDGTGTPGSMITCTAQGPAGSCFILPDTGAPSGWEKWPCVDPKTESECMAQGPYASNDGG